jgi:hypothetical protein
MFVPKVGSRGQTHRLKSNAIAPAWLQLFAYQIEWIRLALFIGALQ